jgi:hypothetical protein
MIGDKYEERLSQARESQQLLKDEPHVNRTVSVNEIRHRLLEAKDFRNRHSAMKSSIIDATDCEISGPSEGGQQRPDKSTFRSSGVGQTRESAQASASLSWAHPRPSLIWGGQGQDSADESPNLTNLDHSSTVSPILEMIDITVSPLTFPATELA